MVAGHNLVHAYHEYPLMIDSLLREGYRIRNLEAQHQEISLQDTAVYPAKTKPGNSNTWSYIKYLDAVLPSKFPLYVFSDNLTQNFAGTRPSLQLDFHWISLKHVPDPDTVRAYTFTDNTGAVRFVDHISSATGNHYQENTTATRPETETIASVHIGIYPGNNLSDARYLKAAISAIRDYTGRNITVHDSPVNQLLNIIFWLQDAAPQENVIRSLAADGTFFRYEKAAGSSLSVNTPSENKFHQLDKNNPSTFYRYTSDPAADAAGEELVTGDELMNMETKGDQRFISFNSRLNPKWTDLVWKESFVKWVMPLILPAPIQPSTDLRKMDPLQATPGRTSAKVNGTANTSALLNQTDLSFVCWILVFIALTTERIMTHHQKKKKDA